MTPWAEARANPVISNKIMPTNIINITNPRITLTILGLVAFCGLVLATHSGQARSAATATVSTKLPAGSPGSQWHWQNPLPQGNTLRGASFVDATTGTVVGDYGTIVKTTDAEIAGQFRAAAQHKICGLLPSQM
jgi:hypothetical protein